VKEIRDFPPNIEDIERVFPGVKARRDVIFTYGPTIYNPGGFELSEALKAHEGVHYQQQGDDPEQIRAWWVRYLTDPDFRFAVELPAHKAEYRTFCHREKNRNARSHYLHQIAMRLAGPLYGRLITLQAAKAKILA
jgi:hypothetical protein